MTLRTPLSELLRFGSCEAKDKEGIEQL
ncbi:uncharacterized protein G2W53_027290 [Senna tora]|uniref:Uncharacterized protein n=1 Tax=Senna tora TaxID=362788 RepID=A0A834THD7_9FABA|nr:uncharacterized protein G2W53_027290 [Senna tora]